MDDPLAVDLSKEDDIQECLWTEPAYGSVSLKCGETMRRREVRWEAERNLEAGSRGDFPSALASVSSSNSYSRSSSRQHLTTS